MIPAWKLERLRYLVTACPGFLPTRDQWEEVCQIAGQVVGEIELLEATLDGDPHMTATPDQRRMWRASAVRYADQLEAENAALKDSLTRMLGERNHYQELYVEENTRAAALREASRWIPIEEQMPDLGGSNSSGQVIMGGDGWVGQGHYSALAEKWYYANGHETLRLVTHWQLLPEPPRKDGEK